mmetsp:Transcript_84010/g.271549  ORF Transcript_84010/g.271549 Transcript_84010/m.271549 type:complete len:169 (-) Transcript_84010:100-606(-)
MTSIAANGQADEMSNEHVSENQRAGRLRRAAAASDHDKFLEFLKIGRWTADGVNASCVDSSNKNPLHLASWRGSIENVRTLLELRVDLECISNGSHNYGKTAIFFAITRCRDDVVSLLLSAAASVKVVNNKAGRGSGVYVLWLGISNMGHQITTKKAKATNWPYNLWC